MEKERIKRKSIYIYTHIHIVIMAVLKMQGVGMQMVAFLLLLLISHGWISSSPLLVAEASDKLSVLDPCLRQNLTTGVCDPNPLKRQLPPPSPESNRGCKKLYGCRDGSLKLPNLWCMIWFLSSSFSLSCFLDFDLWNEVQSAVHLPDFSLSYSLLCLGRLNMEVTRVFWHLIY